MGQSWSELRSCQRLRPETLLGSSLACLCHGLLIETNATGCFIVFVENVNVLSCLAAKILVESQSVWVLRKFRVCQTKVLLVLSASLTSIIILSTSGLVDAWICLWRPLPFSHVAINPFHYGLYLGFLPAKNS